MAQRSGAPAGSGETIPDLDPATRDFLKALASPTRQRIMMLFGGDLELSVGEIADRIGISQSTASQQLTLLRRGGILTCRRDGKTVYYRTDRERSLNAVAQLHAYISTCC